MPRKHLAGLVIAAIGGRLGIPMQGIQQRIVSPLRKLREGCCGALVSRGLNDLGMAWLLWWKCPDQVTIMGLFLPVGMP